MWNLDRHCTIIILYGRVARGNPHTSISPTQIITSQNQDQWMHSWYGYQIKLNPPTTVCSTHCKKRREKGESSLHQIFPHFLDWLNWLCADKVHFYSCSKRIFKSVKISRKCSYLLYVIPIVRNQTQLVSHPSHLHITNSMLGCHVLLIEHDFDALLLYNIKQMWVDDMAPLFLQLLRNI